MDTNLQKISALGGCSLQEAIWATNLGNNEAIVANESGAMTTIETECVLEDDGKGGYTIVLPGDTTFQMTHVVDDPFNYMGPTATPIVLSDVIIEANGALIEHASIDTFFRAFAVGTVGFATGERQAPGAGALTIRNAHIRGFAVKGGDGAYGGGGGLGAGGAIYVHGGSLTVESSTFQGNAVYGGNGSRNVLNTGGGGGGGLSGNGARAGEAPQDTGQDQGGGGGGGGGARGDGGTGWSNCGSPCLGIGAEGGGGGGTLGDGQNAGGSSDSRGGFDCGGRGGHLDWTLDQDGDDGSCPGGGGGGGRDSLYAVDFFQIGGNGGDGNYGGGGGGGAGLLTPGHGGHGGFGGGGGGVYPGHSAPPYICSPDGGDGGFGGGGGAGPGGFACPPGIYTGPGRGGSFAGNASDRDGGGGAGLGGAIFNHSGYVRVLNSTFTANDAARGTAGSWPNNEPANSGQDQGAAIFSVGGTLTVLNSTIYGNKGTSSINGGAGIVVYAPGYDIFSPVMQIPPTRFELRNTIIANNAAGSVVTKECRLIDSDDNSVVFVGSGNLIEANDNCDEGHDLSDDPLLESLKLNPPGLTPTMALTADSPAIDAADGANALATDQRGVARPVGLESDIGAFEWGAAVAKCKDVTVSANDSCTAHASIDDGSFAPGGGDILLSQDPPGPYALGETQVTLTASHESGEADSCEATVTVVDDTPPVITVTNAIPVLSPMRKHDLVNVGLGATATDACSTAPTNFQVAVFGDEDDETPTSADLTVFSPDATSLATRTLRLRAERMDSADGRVYLMSLSGTDGAGNTGYGCATVVVPHNSSAASLALVSGQAQDAVSWCSANDGAAPAGFSVIGDGPTIGPKPKK